jgi:hypothetical protein
MGITAQDLMAFVSARERLLKIIHREIGSCNFGKGYEGIVSITFPSCLDEHFGDHSCIVSLEAARQFTRNNVWSGVSLSAVVDKMNKDIDLYEKNLTRHTDQPDNHGS